MTACLLNRLSAALLFLTICTTSGPVCRAAPIGHDKSGVAKAQPQNAPSEQHWAIAIHGGAGENEWEHMDSATAAAYHDSLAKALAAGTAVLQKHGKALDAVTAAVKVLEDDPLFNAGRGSAFDADGKNEMDAALMDGATLSAGSVA